jgi:hypothetical protein
MNGGWSLTLNLQPSGTKFLGDAILNLSNGRTLPFALNGTFSTKTGQSNLKLSGVNAGRGAKLNLTATGVPPGLNKVSGNVLGVALN